MLVGHWWELLLILLLVLLVFGAGRLGDVGGALGKSIHEFKRATRNDEDTTSTRT